MPDLFVSALLAFRQGWHENRPADGAEMRLEGYAMLWD